MLILTLAFFIGVIAGLRALTAPTIASWAAKLGFLPLAGTWLAWMGFQWTPWIFTVLAIGELINDKLPATPSRKVPPQFAARVVMGALAGAVVTTPHGGSVEGLVLGAIGAVAGTLGGAELRGRLAKAIGGKDLPIALLEDCIAILGGILIMRQFA
ncbi:MAG TPA: DUF4126 domain-containing protein [Acidobacteriaceae bacterium]|jgi:uncharacterized membrane protein